MGGGLVDAPGRVLAILTPSSVNRGLILSSETFRCLANAEAVDMFSGR